MASLFIKSSEAADLADRLARAEKTTKTRAVVEALRDRLAKHDPEPPKKDYLAWVQWHHRTYPLPPRTGLLADKAFYDSLNDEDRD